MKAFYNLRLSVTILPFLAGCSMNSGQETDPLSLLSEYDSVIPQLLEKRQVPGIAFAVIQDGSVILKRGYGYSRTEPAALITDTTRFNIGSVSKTMTAWGVMKLVEEGTIELDDDVDRYLKRWHLPKTDFDNRRVTVRRLLNHTSGLSTYPINESLNGYPLGSKLPLIEDALSRVFPVFGNLRLIEQPGENYHYNNGNYLILQLLIEDITGKLFQEYMDSVVFSPLSMQHTGYSGGTDVATGYNEDNEAYETYTYIESGSGGVLTTAEDLAMFLCAIDGHGELKPGRGILKPETVDQMLTPTLETRGLSGLGYQINLLRKFGYFIGHEGANEGYRSIFLFDPQKHSGIIILSNSDKGGRIFAEVICIWTKWADIELAYPCPEPRLPHIASLLY